MRKLSFDAGPLPADPVERAEARNARANKLLVALAVVAVVALIGFGTAVTALTYFAWQGQQEENRDADDDREIIKAQGEVIKAQAEEIKGLGREIRDCTTPGVDSDCQRRLAESARSRPNASVEEVKRYTAAVVICARREQTEPAVRACIDQLAPPRVPPPPPPPR